MTHQVELIDFFRKGSLIRPVLRSLKPSLDSFQTRQFANSFKFQCSHEVTLTEKSSRRFSLASSSPVAFCSFSAIDEHWRKPLGSSRNLSSCFSQGFRRRVIFFNWGQLLWSLDECSNGEWQFVYAFSAHVCEQLERSNGEQAQSGLKLRVEWEKSETSSSSEDQLSKTVVVFYNFFF